MGYDFFVFVFTQLQNSVDRISAGTLVMVIISAQYGVRLLVLILTQLQNSIDWIGAGTLVIVIISAQYGVRLLVLILTQVQNAIDRIGAATLVIFIISAQHVVRLLVIINSATKLNKLYRGWNIGYLYNICSVWDMTFCSYCHSTAKLNSLHIS